METMKTAPNEKTEYATGKCHIMLLPYQILGEILCRLPIKSLVQCKRVCKAWLQLISGPEFFHLQNLRSPATYLFLTYPNFKRIFLLQKGDNRNFKLLYLKEKFPSSTNLCKIPVVDFLDISFVGSCDGLVCLSDGEGNPSGLVNPITDEYMGFPRSRDFHGVCLTSGFGVIFRSRQYKVIRIWRSYDFRYVYAEVYTLGTGCWRKITDGYISTNMAFYSFKRDDMNSGLGTFINGVVHWVVCDSNGLLLLCAFDLAAETFHSLSLPVSFCEPVKDMIRPKSWNPPNLCGDFKKMACSLDLGTMRGCLVACVYDKHVNHFDVDLWVMTEYGIAESWSKQFVIRNWVLKNDLRDEYYPILVGISETMDIVLLHKPYFFAYNLENGSFRLLKPQGVCAIAYVPTFASLAEIKAEDIFRRCPSDLGINHDDDSDSD